MAEMVLRTGKRRKKGMLDGKRRFALPSAVQLQGLLRFAAEAAPGFLLALAEVIGIPSGLHLSWMAALSALDKPIGKPAAGAVAAMLLRLLWGFDPRWEGLISIALMWLGPMVVCGRGNAVLMGFTAAAMLPGAVAACFAPTAEAMLLSWAGIVLSALAAPLMYRGLKALTESAGSTPPRHLDSMEERVCVAFMALLMICGGARLLVLGVNIGALMASLAVLLTALYLGVGAGCAAGMLSGVTMALQGFPLTMSAALALGGFLAGVVQALGRRRLTCCAFALGALLAMTLSGSAGVGCGAAVLAAALAGALMPPGAVERGQAVYRRFLSDQPAPGDAYAASTLAAWEKTVDAMAMAVPSPIMPEETRDGRWWEHKLCEGCPDMPCCGCMTTEAAVGKAETVWDCREADEPIWQDALEELRGLGCQRLYHLRQSMDYLRQEDAAYRRSIRNACYQRDMLVTHLTAMAGAARRFAMLSAGESWWDDYSARRIRRELADAAAPVRLSWVRRVQGHVQAAFELQFITGARRQAEELCGLVSAVIDAPVEVRRIDGDRVELAQSPVFHAVCGIASAAFGGSDGGVCGDTVWSGILQDGRFMAVLSDGMGHGESAALFSRETAELLRLCLDAGYTSQQALTAVNGMMLLSGHGERFTTADLIIIDLWSGHASLDKLGAAGTWLCQEDKLTYLTGDALPIGILEHIESRTASLRLHSGDALVLITDGVEEAFKGKAALETRLKEVLNVYDPQAAAEALVQSAIEADGGRPRDDQTVMVIRLENTEGVQSGEDDV